MGRPGRSGERFARWNRRPMPELSDQQRRKMAELELWFVAARLIGILQRRLRFTSIARGRGEDLATS